MTGEATVAIGGHDKQLPWRGWLPFDLNGDGVDDQQFRRVVVFGPDIVAPTVPEPASGLLMFMGVAAVLASRQRRTKSPWWISRHAGQRYANLAGDR